MKKNKLNFLLIFGLMTLSVLMQALEPYSKLELSSESESEHFQFDEVGSNEYKDSDEIRLIDKLINFEFNKHKQAETAFRTVLSKNQASQLSEDHRVKLNFEKKCVRKARVAAIAASLPWGLKWVAEISAEFGKNIDFFNRGDKELKVFIEDDIRAKIDNAHKAKDFYNNTFILEKGVELIAESGDPKDDQKATNKIKLKNLKEQGCEIKYSSDQIIDKNENNKIYGITGPYLSGRTGSKTIVMPRSKNSPRVKEQDAFIASYFKLREEETSNDSKKITKKEKGDFVTEEVVGIDRKTLDKKSAAQNLFDRLT